MYREGNMCSTLLGTQPQPTSAARYVAPCHAASLPLLTSQWKCKPETGSPSEMMQAMLSTSAICKERNTHRSIKDTKKEHRHLAIMPSTSYTIVTDGYFNIHSQCFLPRPIPTAAPWERAIPTAAPWERASG